MPRFNIKPSISSTTEPAQPTTDIEEHSEKKSRFSISKTENTKQTNKQTILRSESRFNIKSVSTVDNSPPEENVGVKNIEMDYLESRTSNRSTDLLLIDWYSIIIGNNSFVCSKLGGGNPIGRVVTWEKSKF